MNQLEIEEKFSRKSIRHVVMEDIDYESDVYTECVHLVMEYRSKFYYKSKNARIRKLKLSSIDIVTELFIAVLTLHQMSPIQSVATILANRMGYSELLDGIKTASEIIAICEQSHLYTLYHSTHEINMTETLALLSNFKLSSAAQLHIDETMYLPPMIERPMNWLNNSTGGYLKGSGSCILGRLNHHEMKQDLETLNIIQAIPWEINEYMLDFTEESKKPLDTEQKEKQFELMREISRKVACDILYSGNKFYFTWKNDKRGRMNCQGYHISLQSTDYKKAIINFAHKELVI